MCTLCSKTTSHKLLTKFEEAIPRVTEFLPWFGNERSEPLGNRPSIHGCLEGAEHEVQCTDVVLGVLGNLIFQTAQSALVQNGCHTCEEKAKKEGDRVSVFLLCRVGKLQQGFFTCHLLLGLRVTRI